MASTGRAMFKTELNEITTGSKKIKKKKKYKRNSRKSL